MTRAEEPEVESGFWREIEVRPLWPGWEAAPVTYEGTVCWDVWWTFGFTRDQAIRRLRRRLARVENPRHQQSERVPL